MPNAPAITQRPTDQTRLVVQATFPHLSPHELFDCFTQPERLIQWWPPQAVTDPQLGGRYTLSWPEMNWQLVGEYLTFEPGQRLVFSWQWPHAPHLPQRHVEIIFSPNEVGAQIVLTHAVYADTPQDQEDRQSHWEGWRHFFAQLQTLTP